MNYRCLTSEYSPALLIAIIRLNNQILQQTSIIKHPKIRMKNKKSVLFIYLEPTDSDYNICDRPEYRLVRRPQLGFQYLSAVLDEKGIKNDIIDQTIISFNIEDIVQKIKQEEILFIGFYTVDVLEGKVCQFTRQIKQKVNCPIVIGGPGTLKSNSYLEAGADLLCIGEGERTILEIVDFLNGIREIDDVKGICYLKNNQIIYNQPQELIKNLDEIPFPNRDKIDIKHYRDFFLYNMRLPYTTMTASRGCTYHCSFCTSHQIWNGKVRTRSVENVIKEIDILVKKYGVKYISFQDDVFGLNKKWLKKFTDILINRKYDLNLMCILHPFSFRKNREEMLTKLWNAGFNTISIGLQSADFKILEGIKRRPQEPASAMSLVKIAKNKGFLTSMSFIFGLPGETEDTIKKSIDYILQCKPHHAEFYSLTVLQGSLLEKEYHNKAITSIEKNVIRDWARYATKKFYRNPLVIWQNLYYIICNRPGWLLKLVKFSPILFTLIGYKKARPRVKRTMPLT